MSKINSIIYGAMWRHVNYALPIKIARINQDINVTTSLLWFLYKIDLYDWDNNSSEKGVL